MDTGNTGDYHAPIREIVVNRPFSSVVVTFPKLTLMATLRIRSESELFTGDTSKDNHSPGPVFREVSP